MKDKSSERNGVRLVGRRRHRHRHHHHHHRVQPFICSDDDDQNFRLICLMFVFCLSVYFDRAVLAVSFLKGAVKE